MEEQQLKQKPKGKFTIGGITIGRLFDYFFIYSVIGYIIETVFALVVYGVFESRKSFLYGPFCSIYGIGAIMMIPILNLKYIKKNKITLFLGGFIVGSIVEYVISLIGELIFNMRWWDYSSMPYNINGRICLLFSFFWGILAIILIRVINPKVDKIINKIPKKCYRTVTIIGVIIIIIDCIATGIALKMFFVRLINTGKIELPIIETHQTLEYGTFYKTDFAKYLETHFFTDEAIIKAFPNIKMQDKNGDTIWIKTLFPEIKPYYIQVFVPKHN